MDVQTASRDDLVAYIGTLQATVAALEARVREFEARQGSGPPRGMPGHKPGQRSESAARPRKRRARGYGRRRSTPTEQVVHAVAQCPDCGGALVGGSRQRRREVLEGAPAAGRGPGEPDRHAAQRGPLAVSADSMVSGHRPPPAAEPRGAGGRAADGGPAGRGGRRADSSTGAREPRGAWGRDGLARERAQRLRVDLQHLVRAPVRARQPRRQRGGYGAGTRLCRGAGERLLRRLRPRTDGEAALLGTPAAGCPCAAPAIPRRYRAGRVGEPAGRAVRAGAGGSNGADAGNPGGAAAAVDAAGGTPSGAGGAGDAAGDGAAPRVSDAGEAAAAL